MTSPPPPGWYPDGQGWRWWDGQRWGPAAPPSSPAGPSATPAPSGTAPADPVGEGKIAAVLSHVSYFVAGLVLPLVFLLTEGKRNAYVRHHAAEALNFALTFLLAWLVAFALLVPVAVLSTSGLDDDDVPLGVLAWFGLVGLLWLAGAACSVVGAVRAGQGVWWRYPASIRLVRGAADPATPGR